MPEVVSFGILVADLIAYPIKELPEKGKLVLAERMQLSTGGGAANTAVGLKKLGIDVAIIGRVGTDGLGDFVINKLNEAGLNTAGIKRDPDKGTCSCMVLVHPDGERSFIYYHGANTSLKAEDVDFSLLKGCKVFHVGYALFLPSFDGPPAGELLKKIQQRGCLTVVDTAWDNEGKWMTTLEPYLPYTDVFLPSLNEAQMLSGKEEPPEIAQFFLDCGVKVVGIKLGSQGSYVQSQEEKIWAPHFKVNPVDTTGAGDSFVAGFIAGLVKGWPLEQVARFANAVGALATTGLGATAGVKDMETTLRFMEKSSY
ncbi:sugar kinase [Moorella naiadis]|uniref:carbohydrate kinase family protein n=1 Tax=Moorella naiadis (nom. illeg.) TaxID=3093670 RepID=UPI003D9CBC69